MLDRIAAATQEFVLLALFFALLTLVFEGVGAFGLTKRQKRNWRVNLSYFAFDLLAVIPVLVFVVAWVQSVAEGVPSVIDFAILPPFLVMFLVVLVSDFVGYWRHRLMHVPRLWPIHAAHHSDEDVTWFTLNRFHPFNRLIAVVFDVLILALLDFPLWAILLSNRIRHYYGYFVHSDIKGRYGPLKYIFVSPFLHRWHHATNIEARDKNFATIFSFFDVMFGTFYCPKENAHQLGVDDPSYPTGFIGQLLFPFKAWANPAAPKSEDAGILQD